MDTTGAIDGQTDPARESPTFIWDRTITVDELRRILDDPDHPERLDLLALVLREARPQEVWDFVSPQDVADALPALAPLLGRQRRLWTWLVESWRDRGFLS